MPLTLNGTTGIAGIDGSAGTPALRGTDTNTGIVFGSDTLSLATGGNSAALTVDANSNVTFPATTVMGSSFLRNRIINGDMRIDQRNAGASVTATGNPYTLDRWQAVSTQSAKYTVQQNAGSVTPPAGFTNYLGVTSLSAYSVLSTDLFILKQAIEGVNVADLDFGTASAATVTISFWVRSSLTGTFGGSIKNAAASLSYPFTFIISSVNTWEKKTITISGSTSGTWLTNTSVGIELNINLGAGSTYSASSGSWAAGNYVAPTGATSVVGTNGATFYLTGVQFEVGSVATPFERRLYPFELQLCQRYCWKGIYFGNGYGDTTNVLNVVFYNPVSMRAQPTTFGNDADSNGIVGNGTLYNLNANSGSIENNWWFQNCGHISFTTTAQITRWTTVYARIPNLLLACEL